MGNQVFEFGKIELSLVTGSCFGLYPTIDDDPASPFQDLFATRSSLTFGRLSGRLGEYAIMDPDGPFTRKLAILYLIYSLVFVKGMNNAISFKSIRLTDDPAMFNAFPWGRLIYEELVKEWAHAFSRIADSSFGKIQLKFATMPFGVQAWVLECLGPKYSSIFAEQYVSALVIYKLNQL
ncbi:hypothetical protein LIER_29604 [Lithospermum erythrorhizon]|uniref:DUF1985 domain-containing protein n=1 Tax=Lithospermum erythrorhizon TaxID=34254 RepID=A0AAV3RL85_LITER